MKLSKDCIEFAKRMAKRNGVSVNVIIKAYEDAASGKAVNPKLIVPCDDNF